MQKYIGIQKMMKMKNYKNLHRGEWAELKLSEVVDKLPNKVVSDIGAGFGWFRPVIEKFNLEWQPFDYVRKIEESTMWDLNNPVPEGMKKPGFVVFMEVLEHLSNPELGIRNISNHTESGAYMTLTVPNPLSAQSKVSMILNNSLFAFQEKHLIEWHVFVQQRNDDMRSGCVKNGVAIRRRIRHHRGADDGVATCAVFHHHLLPPQGRQMGADQARRRIGAATRRIRHHEAHGPYRVAILTPNELRRC